MKRIIRNLILLSVFILLGIILFRQNISPCDYPIPYKIGSIDPKFGLSKSEVESDVETATNIWSSVENKKLFMYSPTAKLTVNFVYDTRAELDTQINQLHDQLDQKGVTLSQQVKAYKSDVTQFQQKLAVFNATVEAYNKAGGAPPDVYQSLQATLKEIRSEGDALNQRARELNLSTEEYNVGVSNLNDEATQFNNEIALKPEEGLYNGAENTITLYFANNHDELIHTLTHEFGHALGMDHVKNPEAIMYPYTTKYLAPTPEDIGQLAFACKTLPLPIFWARIFDTWLAIHIYPIIQHYISQIKS